MEEKPVGETETQVGNVWGVMLTEKSVSRRKEQPIVSNSAKRLG